LGAVLDTVLIHDQLVDELVVVNDHSEVTTPRPSPTTTGARGAARGGKLARVRQ